MLSSIPLLFMLAGLAAYAVLAGADFGAGFWIIFFGGQSTIRDYARHAMGPVWEANHVWLIFVLVVCWTAYPVAFASIVSTLTVPIFIAAVGIILRGAAYALRAQLHLPHHQLLIERVFALSSILTPFAMGAAIGSIASGRVPVGNATGNLVTSWLNPTSILTGTLAVAISSYLAAVYLAADAHRMGHPEMELSFRRRALGAGIVTGAIALAGLAILRFDDLLIWRGLTSGGGLTMILVSVGAGVLTIALEWRGHFGPARVSAALAVVAILTGWAIAQRPQLLPGLTVDQAAAGRSTLIAVVIGVALGAIVLVPSLLLLFRLFLHGRLDVGAHDIKPLPYGSHSETGSPRLIGAFLITCLLFGATATVFGEGWAQVVGICCLCSSAIPAFIFTAGTT